MPAGLSPTSLTTGVASAGGGGGGTGQSLQLTGQIEITVEPVENSLNSVDKSMSHAMPICSSIEHGICPRSPFGSSVHTQAGGGGGGAYSYKGRDYSSRAAKRDRRFGDTDITGSGSFNAKGVGAEFFCSFVFFY